MANNPEDGSKYESYHEVPASKYLFLKSTAIHKRLFLYWTLFIWVAIWVSTRIINVDLLLLQFHLVNWWLFIPEAVIVLGYVYLWKWNRKCERKELEAKRQKRAREQLQVLIKEAGGETKK